MHGICLFGSPGSGKTTLCHALTQLLSHMDYDCISIDLDPSSLEEDCYDISIKDLVTADEVQNLEGLGPNGAILYSMEFLKENVHWLSAQISALAGTSPTKRQFLLIDFPGQVECYVAYDTIDSILTHLLVDHKHNLCGLLLTEAYNLLNPRSLLSAGLSIAAQQVSLGIPALLVASKGDLLSVDQQVSLTTCLETGVTDTVSSLSRVRPFHLAMAEFLDANLSLLPFPISVDNEEALQLLFQEVARILGM
ncbi:ATP-binding protein [Giardia lamblia P15]|uniref:GPN-loop GTPase 2 n=1 Tax=Giardia intestinalis (strain P15) TaxID=658858 RepID=E1F3G1_GIAIA|nr:ATP-binding protein [Giardia lamblia P15]